MTQPVAPARAAPPLRPGIRGWTLILALGLAYIWLVVFVPLHQRIALTGGAFALLLFILRPGVRPLLLVSPLVVGFATRVVPMEPFYPIAATLFGLVLAVWWVLEKLVHDEPAAWPRGAGLKLVVAAAAIQTVSIAVSIHAAGQDFWNAVRDGSSLFLFMPLVFMITDRMSDRQSATRLARAAVLTLLALGVTGLVQYLGISGFYRFDIDIGYLYRGRVAATFPSPNLFAGYLELSVPLALGMFFHERRLAWRAVCLAAALCGFASALFTFSRGGFLMTTFGSACVLVYHFRRRPLIPVMAGAAFVLFLLGHTDTFARQLSLVTEPSDVVLQPTLVHRFLTYRSFWNVILENPLAGVGWGAQEFYTGRTAIYTFWDVRHAVSDETIVYFGGLNSFPLNMALKGGIISAASALVLAAGVVRAFLWSLRRGGGLPAASVACGIVSFAGHNLVDNLVRWPQGNAYFWFYLGLMIALGAASRPGGASCPTVREGGGT